MQDDSVELRHLKLKLADLSEGLPAITPAFGQSCAEAGAVCLEDQGHSCGTNLQVGGSFSQAFELDWSSVHDQARRCWNDPQIATEHGAYGLAFLLIRALTDFTVIDRSYKGPGFDYWLGHDDGLFQGKARLEVSGIRSGTEAQVNYRVKEKLTQTEPSDKLNLPAYIVVVEFNQPQSKVVVK